MDRFEALSGYYTAMADQPKEEGNSMIYDSMAQTVKEVKEEVYEDIIFDLNDILCSLADQGCMLDEELDRWCEVMKKFREAKGFE